jgi:16S rRNA (guanine527-N7)-methyltransferase
MSPGEAAGQDAAGPRPGVPRPGVPSEAVATAESLFRDQLARAEDYAWLLTTTGVQRGLIGPGEAPRVWQRHLFNCAVVGELIPAGASVVDVGSGAGLPGVALALARPDLTITLVEAMERRVTFLHEVVAALDLASRVVVLRARAEESTGQLAPARVVTARALAPLDRLARWCLPLATMGGQVLAIKGASAGQEVAAHTRAVRQLGGSVPVIRQCGAGRLELPTTVVEIRRERRPARRDQRPAGTTG